MDITNALIEGHSVGRFETAGYPGLFVLAATGQPVVRNSTLRR